VIILLVRGMIRHMTDERGRQGGRSEAALRNQGQFAALKYMLGRVEKVMEYRRETPMPGGGYHGMDVPEDTVSPECEIHAHHGN